MVSVCALLLGAAALSEPEPSERAPDPTRTAWLAVGGSLFGLNAVVTPIGAALSGFECRTCAPHRGAAWLSSLPMVFTPSLGRWAVGDAKGALAWTALRAAAWTVGAVVVSTSGDHDVRGWVAVTAYLTPLMVGLADLATTPHREDLAPAPGVAGVVPAPIVGPHGAVGTTVDAYGVF